MHASRGRRGPAWLRAPGTSTRWYRPSGRRTGTKNADGVLTVGGVDVRDLAAEHGSRRTCSTRRTSARGRASSSTLSAASTSTTRGKAFLCAEVARWVDRGGPRPRRLYGRRAGAGPPRRLPMPTIGMHGNNKSDRRAGPSPRRRGRPDRRRLVSRDRAAGRLAERAGRDTQVMVRIDRRGRGTHPRVHRHGPRGPEVRLLARQR